MSDAPYHHPADGLEDRARDLADEVGQLRLSVEQLTRRTVRAEKLSTRTALAAVILLVVLVLIGFGGYRQIVTEDRLNASVAQQEREREEALCPVFALVVGGYNPSTRPLNDDGTYPGSPREQYDTNFQVMRRSYDALNCTAPLVPPRSGG